MKKLRFKYVNHREIEHEYTIEPEALSFKDNHWQITGICLERDGESRRGHYENFPIRSFIVTKMRDMEEVA